MKAKLRVWCLSDGRPGHYNQTKGMLHVLQKGYELDIVWIETTLRVKPLRKLLRLLLNKRKDRFATWIRASYGFNCPENKPDLILSTGGNTAYLNIALAVIYQCENYFIGSLRGLKPELFSKVFTIEPIGARNNVVMPLAPVPIDRIALQARGRELQDCHSGVLWTLLVGGSTTEYRYTSEDWVLLAQQMNTVARKHGIRWLVTTSRRTGIEPEQLLAKYLDESLVAEATWYGQQPRKVMVAYLGAADRIFCTEDSLSMLTEAIYSGKSVTSLNPNEMSPSPRYAAAISRLLERGWLQRCDMRVLAVPERELNRGCDLDPAEIIWDMVHSKC